MRARAYSVLAVSTLLMMSALTAAPSASASTTDVSAAELPSLLVTADETASPRYDRNRFEHWIDADGDGCNTRYEVLIEESTTPVGVGEGCTLSGGTWVSPYDGVTATTPSGIEIDHVVALAEAWRSGASGWTDQQRRLFANDLDVPYALTAASTASNQSKSDKDPAEWLPTNTAYTCEYVVGWTLTKYRWSLAADAAEKSALTQLIAEECGDLTVTLPDVVTPDIAPPVQTVIQPFSYGLNRLAGADRYATAVATSQRYAPGVPVLFVATGENFPDALSGAAAAALMGGPLLLTPGASLPASVLSEAARLQPAKIYVLGSTATLSGTVATQLAEVAPVTRLGGADRYETGRLIIGESFSSSGHAIIATGRNFPDALAATGAAGTRGAPVVLVDGLQPGVDAQTLALLRRLGVSSVSIAGSSASVSTGVENSLWNAGFSVSRYGGNDRYETAALINNAYFPSGSTSTVFLAVGTRFPDALAGAAMAGRLNAPLYITATECVPPPVHASLNRLGASTTVALGSTLSVSDAAARNTECVPPPPTPEPQPPAPQPQVPGNPGNSVNCDDFRTWRDAQNWFLTYNPYYGDVAKLDADHDGIACESLPGAP